MKHLLRPAGLAVMAFMAPLAATPAFAQMVPGASGVGSAMSAPAPQPRQSPSDIAPPALPGAGIIGGIATAPKLKKANTGDPTTDLFTAINNGNYGDAQDAISRGADLNAQNPLGETPLDLAIALNQNSITFMILSARNEGDSGQPVQAVAAPLPGASHAVTHAKLHPTPAREIAADAAPMPVAHVAPAAPPPAGDAGQPNVSVGFLGFSQK